MKTSTLYIYFNGECENAFNLYKEVFQTDLLNVTRYRDIYWQENIPSVPKEYLDKIENTGLRVSESMVLMGSDIIDPENGTKKMKYNFSIYLEAETKEEAERVFNGLSEKGSTTMPLQIAHWGDLFGMCTDRFGINWMVNYKEIEFCQSCGMPLDKDEVGGTNADGSKNSDYCIYCYTGGAFTVDCTMEEMIGISLTHMKEMFKDDPNFNEQEALNKMNSFFPKLKRWAK